MPQRVALVSCVKSKLAAPTAAKDLYTSALFRGMRAYAEIVADAWYILSAEHGLLDPERTTAPYERTLNRMPAAERAAWAGTVKKRLEGILPIGADVVMLAGERYREHLIPFLKARGHRVEIPLEGLPLGRQLRELNRLTRSND